MHHGGSLLALQVAAVHLSGKQRCCGGRFVIYQQGLLAQQHWPHGASSGVQSTCRSCTHQICSKPLHCQRTKQGAKRTFEKADPVLYAWKPDVAWLQKGRPAGEQCGTHVCAPCFMGMSACGSMAVAQEARRMMHCRQLPALLLLLCFPGCQIAHDLHKELRCRCRMNSQDGHVCNRTGVTLANHARGLMHQRQLLVELTAAMSWALRPNGMCHTRSTKPSHYPSHHTTEVHSWPCLR